MGVGVGVGDMKIIDISQELFSCNVYPGDTPPAFERVKTVERDQYNLTNITLCVHNGTHIDAPRHFIAGGKAVDGLDLSVFYGKCTVAEFSGAVGADDVAPVLATCRERLLWKGDCEISGAAAELIAKSRVRLVGVESQSVGNADAPMSVHLILLGAGIIPLEGLNLSAAAPGEYTLAAFPLNMSGSDGSPVRAVLIEDQLPEGKIDKRVN
jgi:arylformamidase